MLDKLTPFHVAQGDARDLLKKVPDASVHLFLTDPPYFIDGMGSNWDDSVLRKKQSRAGVIGSLPVGMKFDPKQGLEFQKFMSEISQQAYRVLKPGGFFISFSQARLYHRLACAAEDVGFEMRDMIVWQREGQAKAFSMDHFVKKMKIDDARKAAILKSLAGRKTPQLKPCIEPLILAQKPKEGTFIENWLAHETGLIDTTSTLDSKFPANLMPVPKPSQAERGEDNDHITVKPVKLMRHLVELFSIPGQIVLDPFLGSGSTGVAAVAAGRRFLGFELEAKFARLSRLRIEKASHELNSLPKA